MIVALGDVRIEDSEDLQRALGAATVGTTNVLKVIRGRDARDVTVTLAERPQHDE